jgi:hypothetical protein
MVICDEPNDVCQLTCAEGACVGSDANATAADTERTAQAPPTWAPIETAPKDGQPVLTWGCIHERGSDVGERPRVQLSRFGRYGWESCEWGGHEPTHWAPLPEPPRGDEQI